MESKTAPNESSLQQQKQGEQGNVPVNLSNMLEKLVYKTDIDFTKLMTAKDGNTQIQYIILKSTDCNRRVNLQSEVRLQIQKYFFNTQKNEFIIINKNYKNPIKKKIEAMTNIEAKIRKCMLELYAGQIGLFIIDKADDIEQFNSGILELKIKDEEKEYYESKIYYRIYIEQVINKIPIEPKLLKDYIGYIKKYADEMRYLISIKDYNSVDSWSNGILGKVFTMKKELKKEWDDVKNKKLKKDIYNEMKPIIWNKTIALEKKESQNKKSDYEKAIQCIEKDYFTNFGNDFDWAYLKILGRYAKYCILIKEFAKAEKAMQNIQVNFKTIEESVGILTALEDWMKENKIMKVKQAKNTIKALSATETKWTEHNKNRIDNIILNYSWEESFQEEELDNYLNNVNHSKSLESYLKHDLIPDDIIGK